MGVPDNVLLAKLLLSLLSLTVGGAGAVAFLALHWRHRRRVAERERENSGLAVRSGGSSFHYQTVKRPNCWLAVKCQDPHAVETALSLNHSKPCSWIEGLSGNGDRQLFISPPIAGWVLVMGPALPEPSDDIDACYRFLLELSRKLGQVHYYNASSILSYHAWARVSHGNVQRAYAWAGTTLWNEGSLTQAEADLELTCFDYTETVEFDLAGVPKCIAANNERVHLLAARWSIDPGTIDGRVLDHGRGIVGQPSRRL